MANHRSLKLFIVLCCVNFVNITTGATTCGKTVSDGSYRIVGGYDIGYYKYPWFVALYVGDFLNCGGSLIKSKTVLTAAHCFKRWFKRVSRGQLSYEDIYTIKLGVHNKCQDEETQATYKAESVHIHEKYFKKMPYYDIALIILDGDTSSFTPVCLPNKVIPSNARPKEGFAQGFGRLNYTSKVRPCNLREARVLVESDEACRKMLIFAGHTGKDLKHAVCAGYLEGGIDTCMGDSGGPLLIKSAPDVYTLLGITSHGFKCAEKNRLGVYTDVSHFLDWIKQEGGLKSNSNNIIYDAVEDDDLTTRPTRVDIKVNIPKIRIIIGEKRR